MKVFLVMLMALALGAPNIVNAEPKLKGITIYNFVSESKEYIDRPDLLTAEQAMNFLPQLREVKAILNYFIEKQDLSPFEAMVRTGIELSKIASNKPARKEVKNDIYDNVSELASP